MKAQLDIAYKEIAQMLRSQRGLLWLLAFSGLLSASAIDIQPGQWEATATITSVCVPRAAGPNSTSRSRGSPIFASMNCCGVLTCGIC